MDHFQFFLHGLLILHPDRVSGIGSFYRCHILAKGCIPGFCHLILFGIVFGAIHAQHLAGNGALSELFRPDTGIKRDSADHLIGRHHPRHLLHGLLDEREG